MTNDKTAEDAEYEAEMRLYDTGDRPGDPNVQEVVFIDRLTADPTEFGRVPWKRGMDMAPHFEKWPGAEIAIQMPQTYSAKLKIAYCGYDDGDHEAGIQIERAFIYGGLWSRTPRKLVASRRKRRDRG